MRTRYLQAANRAGLGDRRFTSCITSGQERAPFARVRNLRESSSLCDKAKLEFAAEAQQSLLILPATIHHIDGDAGEAIGMGAGI
jgi:hypothetical protein